MAKTRYYKCKQNLNLLVPIKHKVSHLEPIFDIIIKHGSDLFIELGTLQGGFTLAMHEKFGKSLEIVSFDINEKKYLGRVRSCLGKNVTLVIGEDGEFLEKENSILVNLLTDFSKRKILYCDGGNKEQEIAMYAKYMQIGDVIGRHDYKGIELPDGISEDDFSKFCWDECESKELDSRFWIRK